MFDLGDLPGLGAVDAVRSGVPSPRGEPRSKKCVNPGRLGVYTSLSTG